MRKKIDYLLFITLVFGYLNVNAQVDFGLHFGINSTNVNTSISKEYRDFDFPTKSKFGFNIGVMASYSLNDNMSIESGLLFAQKGYQIDWDAFLKKNNMDGTVDGYWRYDFYYLELPVHFTYHINNFQFFAGSYLAYGIGGTSKIDAKFTSNGESDTTAADISLDLVSGDIEAENFIEEKDGVPFFKSFKAFDFGADFGIGYRYKQYLLRLQYSLGFSNLTPGFSDYDDFDPNNFKFTNKGITLSVTYSLSE